MKKLLRLAVALWACWVGVALAAPYVVTDERGERVRFDAPPQRVVSLLPSLTETVCALGACARLVGVDRYSNWPLSVRELPQLGGGIDPHVEAIVRLKPDVVLLAQSSRVAQRLQSLGLKVLALEPKSHADMQRVLRQIGQVLGLPEADSSKVWLGITQGVAQAAAAVPAHARQARVYIEVSRGPFAASAASFIGETLAQLGAQNIVPAALGPFPKLNPEFVVRANPDLIMIANRSMQADFNYPGWQAIRAVREQRVCVFSSDEADIVVRPGPRMAEAAQIMARCLADKAP